VFANGFVGHGVPKVDHQARDPLSSWHCVVHRHAAPASKLGVSGRCDADADLRAAICKWERAALLSWLWRPLATVAPYRVSCYRDRIRKERKCAGFGSSEVRLKSAERSLSRIAHAAPLR
jgi:hypothetical protein